MLALLTLSLLLYAAELRRGADSAASFAEQWPDAAARARRLLRKLGG